jgi:hypothetical protein
MLTRAGHLALGHAPPCPPDDVTGLVVDLGSVSKDRHDDRHQHPYRPDRSQPVLSSIAACRPNQPAERPNHHQQQMIQTRPYHQARPRSICCPAAAHPEPLLGSKKHFHAGYCHIGSPQIDCLASAPVRTLR